MQFQRSTEERLRTLQETLENQRREQQEEAVEHDELSKVTRQQSQQVPVIENEEGSSSNSTKTSVNMQIIQPPCLNDCSRYDMYKKET